MRIASAAALRESHVHDVAITRESPKYPSGTVRGRIASMQPSQWAEIGPAGLVLPDRAEEEPTTR